MSRLELRIPPVIVVLVLAATMWLLARLEEPSSLPLAARASVAFVLGLAGVSLAVSGVREFRRARTTVDPRFPDRAAAMVTGGVYRRTRNPMYLGMACLLGAWAAWLGVFAPWLGLPAFVLYMNRFQIAPEERSLAQRFGGGFHEYARHVRRWL